THYFCPHLSPPHTYTLSLHDALPISGPWAGRTCAPASTAHPRGPGDQQFVGLVGAHQERRAELLQQGHEAVGLGVMERDRGRCRSEEHTSELQSRFDLVCRLLLEKKK